VAAAVHAFSARHEPGPYRRPIATRRSLRGQLSDQTSVLQLRRRRQSPKQCCAAGTAAVPAAVYGRRRRRISPCRQPVTADAVSPLPAVTGLVRSDHRVLAPSPPESGRRPAAGRESELRGAQTRRASDTGGQVQLQERSRGQWRRQEDGEKDVDGTDERQKERTGRWQRRELRRRRVRKQPAPHNQTAETQEEGTEAGARGGSRRRRRRRVLQAAHKLWTSGRGRCRVRLREFHRGQLFG